MLRVGLTGGVACGKSTVAKMFADLGAEVIDADKIVHQLYRVGEPVYRQLVDHFGKEIVRADGEIDRARLATVVFDGGRVQELNRIVHPAVFQRQTEWVREITAKHPDAIAMVEAALMLESGGRSRYDKIIVVTCTPEQKVARYAQRAGIPETAARNEVERRSRVQMTDQEKAALADYVIDNSGSLEQTQAQAEKIYPALQALVRPSSR